MEIILQKEVIEGKIYMVRGHKVMLSTDLAELYEVLPKVMMQAIKRNIERFLLISCLCCQIKRL